MDADKKEYLISAIISTYNSEQFIRGRIEDLLNQTILDKLEIIIVNSGSRQNEDIIIKEYAKNFSNIKYIKTNERETVYKAWNRGIKIASGKYITNANTDDRLKNNTLEKLADFLENNPQVGLVYADQYISNIKNQTFDEIKEYKSIDFPDFNIVYQLERCIIGSQPMWRSSLHFIDNIWFDESFEVCGDHEFELRVFQKFKIKHINEKLGLFYKSPDKENKEFENPERNLEEVRRIQRTHIPLYLNSLPNDELIALIKHYKKYMLIPIPLLFITKKVLNNGENIYPRHIFHSIEFLYYFNLLLLRQLKKKSKTLRLARRYLKYKKSDLILKAIRNNE